MESPCRAGGCLCFRCMRCLVVLSWPERRASARRFGATAPAHSSLAARGDASGQCRRAGLPAVCHRPHRRHARRPVHDRICGASLQTDHGAVLPPHPRQVSPAGIQRAPLRRGHPGLLRLRTRVSGSWYACLQAHCLRADLPARESRSGSHASRRPRLTRCPPSLHHLLPPSGLLFGTWVARRSAR